jgi:hypothetical protein
MTSRHFGPTASDRTRLGQIAGDWRAQGLTQLAREGWAQLGLQQAADADRLAAPGELDQRALPGGRFHGQPLGGKVGALHVASEALFDRE